MIDLTKPQKLIDGGPFSASRPPRVEPFRWQLLAHDAVEGSLFLAQVDDFGLGEEYLRSASASKDTTGLARRGWQVWCHLCREEICRRWVDRMGTAL
jgi:hypothetical protein